MSKNKTIQIIYNPNTEWVYNVQIFINGEYAGIGKFFKNKLQAIKYARENLK